MVRLGTFAAIKTSETPVAIRRLNMWSMVQITANPAAEVSPAQAAHSANPVRRMAQGISSARRVSPDLVAGNAGGQIVDIVYSRCIRFILLALKNDTSG